MSNSNLNFLVSLILLQFVVVLSMVLDIPYVRQVLGFLFLTIIPGFLLLRILRIKKPNIVETVLFSTGLSLAFLMIIGLLLNELGFLNFVSKPLSIEPLIIVTNVAIFLMNCISFLVNKDPIPLGIKLSIKTLRLWPLLFFLILPILSIIGVLFVKYYNNNIFLMSILVIISIIVSSVASFKISSKLSPYYPLIIASIVISLMLSQALVSNYLYGSDIQSDFNTFMLTKNESYWNSQLSSYYQQSSDNSMMSITVLPTILSNLLSIGPDWVFKILFPLFFSLVPLGLYQLYRRYWTERFSFASVIFFVANYAFLTIVLTNAKEMIGELFYVILFLVLFSRDINYDQSKWVFFLFASFGIIVSHYSMSFMFFLFIVFTWLVGKFFLKNVMSRINGFVVAFYSSLMFLWYLFQVRVLYGGPFVKFVGVINITLVSFTREFFSSASRGEDAQAAIGLVARPSALHYAGTLLYDITILMILIGCVSLIFKWKKGKFNTEFFLVIFLSILLLVSAVVIPKFAGYLELGRLYHILLMFLSPLFVLGAETVFAALSRLSIWRKTLNLKDEHKKTSYCLLLTLVILIPFFLIQTGLVYEVTGDPAPSSIALSRNKLEYSIELLREGDIFSATWLSRYGKVNLMWTFTDRVSLDHVLNSYSIIDRSMLLLLSNTTTKLIADGTYIPHQNSFVPNSNTTYIYLSQINVLQGIITYNTATNQNLNTSQIPVLNSTTAFVNRIYSNSASEIYFRVPR